jgi:cystathionine beta-lyase
VDGYSYGQNGSPTTFALARWIARLEGDGHTVLVPTGLAAVVLVSVTALRAGEHVLVPHTLYGPSRDAFDRLFAGWGIETTTYSARDLAALEAMIRPTTRLIWTESPGSNTMEMQDIPAIAALARVRGIPVAMDNTWATPLGFRPLAHGVTFSVQALTKYVGGHSDLLMGSVTVADERLHRRLRETAELLGFYVSPDECALALRGGGTMALRMERHAASALAVAVWLSRHPAVARVHYPPLPSDPGHVLWARDYTTAAGVLSFVPRQAGRTALRGFVGALQTFRLGASWGGLHSLVAPIPMPDREDAFLLRLHVGLEDVRHLIKDLERAFGALS